MAINSKRRGGLGVAFVLLALTLSSAWARTGVEGTPVPFPQAPSLPSDDGLRSLVVNLQGLTHQAGVYTHLVQTATEYYRNYVVHIKQMRAGCEVDGDLQGTESGPFVWLTVERVKQCTQQVTAYQHDLRQHAVDLDKYVAFAKTVRKAAFQAQDLIDRAQAMRHANRLEEAVKESKRAIRKAEADLNRYMK